MYYFNKIYKFIFDKDTRFLSLANRGFYNYIDDELFLKRMFYASLKYPLNLDNPQSFNEKLQWLKLYNRNSEYISLVDKSKVKLYVAEIIGSEYVIPTYGIYDCFDDINFEKLPVSFVLKCTHDSGSIVIIKNKLEMNIKKVRAIIENSLRNNYFYKGREWPYKEVERRIIAEYYLEDFTDNEIRDYKFFCFDGKVSYMFIATDRFKKSDTCFDFFDVNFHHLPFTNGHPNAEKIPHKPQNFHLMIQLAEKLSSGIPHVRVDFYEANGKVYFGELTFFHFSGFVPFKPQKWDYIFGKKIILPHNK